MNRSERIAQIVVESVLTGSRMDFRPSQSSRTHDFDLCLGDGSLAALEVSSAADASQLSAEAAILDERRGGQFIPRSKAQSDWYVESKPDANIKRIRAEIDAYLADIEAEGITSFHVELQAADSPAVRRIHERLGIESGTAEKWDSPGFIALALPGQGGWLSHGHVHDAIRSVASKNDNRIKLRASGANQRHLFVYVHSSSAMAWMVLREIVAGPLPNLPEEVTHVWACAEYERTAVALYADARAGVWQRRSLIQLPPVS